MKSLFLICTVTASAGSIFTITDLGSLGGSTAQAFGVNSNGQAVGAASNIFGYTHAFTSSGAGSKDLTFNTGASDGIASGINDAGQIIGTQFIDGQARATLWSNGTAQSIAGPESYGTAINNAGQATGMLADGHAFVESNGSVTDMGALSGGNWTSGYAINNSDEIAGYGETGGAFRAFVWTPTTGYVVLETLGGSNSYAMGINDAGQVIGNAQTAGGYSHAFVWSNGVMQDLGTLGLSSYAYGINAAGDVVGYSYIDGACHAFIVEDGAMFDLNNLVDPSSGWLLSAAYAINVNGQIVGSGLFNGVEHAFRLDYRSGFSNVSTQSLATPEPSSSVLALTGAILIVILRIRFRPWLARRQLCVALRRHPVSRP